jgi:hypothetical protein
LRDPDDFDREMTSAEVREFIIENKEAFTPEVIHDAQTIVALLSSLLIEDGVEEYEKLACEVRERKGAFDALVAFTLSGVVAAARATDSTMEETIQRLGNGVAVLGELFSQE